MSQPTDPNPLPEADRPPVDDAGKSGYLFAFEVMGRSITTPPSDSFYRPGLDILRAIAFLLVFVAHGLIEHLDQPTQIGAVARSGEFGVCIFFFLSSYLITELLLREIRDTASIHISAFYTRRILRIWPLYFFMIAVGSVYGLFSPNARVSLAWELSLFGLFTNWYTVGHGYPPGFLFPLWSISLEEQFYLLWPTLVKYLSPTGVFAIASLTIAFAYVAFAVVLYQGRSLDPGAWANSLVQFQFFALGAMVAIVLRGRIPKVSLALRCVFFVAGLLCLRLAQAAVYNNDGHLPHDFVHLAPRFLMTLPGCLFLFFSLLQSKGGGMQKILIYLGKISYGLYVYHVLCLHGVSLLVKRLGVWTPQNSIAADVFRMTLALPVTIVIAAISYRYLESPFLKLKKRFTFVPSRAV